MRAKTIQIVWHGKEPVYSVDFHPDGTLFTGGADKEIKAWEVRPSSTVTAAPCAMHDGKVLG